VTKILNKIEKYSSKLGNNKPFNRKVYSDKLEEYINKLKKINNANQMGGSFDEYLGQLNFNSKRINNYIDELKKNSGQVNGANGLDVNGFDEYAKTVLEHNEKIRNLGNQTNNLNFADVTGAINDIKTKTNNLKNSLSEKIAGIDNNTYKYAFVLGKATSEHVELQARVLSIKKMMQELLATMTKLGTVNFGKLHLEDLPDFDDIGAKHKEALANLAQLNKDLEKEITDILGLSDNKNNASLINALISVMLSFYSSIKEGEKVENEKDKKNLINEMGAVLSQILADIKRNGDHRFSEDEIKDHIKNIFLPILDCTFDPAGTNCTNVNVTSNEDLFTKIKGNLSTLDLKDFNNELEYKNTYYQNFKQ